MPYLRLLEQLLAAVPGALAALLLDANGEVVVEAGPRAERDRHRLIGASIGVAIPRDRSHFGYLSEHHSFGDDDQTTGDYAEDIAAQMLATILGVETPQRSRAGTGPQSCIQDASITHD